MVITSALHAEGRQFNSGRNHAFFKTNTLCFFVPCLIVKTGILIIRSTQKLTKSALEVHPILLHSLSTVELPLTATSLQRPFFFGGQSIHSLLFRTLYNGHLSTTVTFFCPQGGRRKEGQFWKQLREELEPKCVPQLILRSLLGTCRSAIGQFSPIPLCES